jgi:hypothetical protein
MDISKYKDIIRGVFKSYSSLLLPAGIGLVGLLLFIPTQLMSSGLRARIKTESISKADTLASLTRKVVVRDEWRVEEIYQKEQEKDVNEIANLARQSTQRELLSYEIFPEPADKSTLIFETGFGERFIAGVDELIARAKGRDCPTEAELERSKSEWATTGSSWARGLRSEVEATIVDDLCREKAKCASLYVNKADLGGYNFWLEYKYTTSGGWKQAIQDCWYSQLGYWITEDVIDTIRALNSESTTIFTSRVKRLMSVNFPKADKRQRSGRLTASVRKEAKGDKPGYVLVHEEGLAEPCTRRICNDYLDVVHFKLSVVISTTAISEFMQELCSAKEHEFRGWDGEMEPSQVAKHNQMTILEYRITPVDRENKTHMLYRYGEDAVIQLDLTCEYIFDKNGYDEIKPGEVKESVADALKEIQQKKVKKKRPARKRVEKGTSIRSKGPSVDI